MNRLKYLSCIVITLVMGGSCSKSFTSITPTNNIYAADAITSVENVRAAVNGLYYLMATSDYYGRTAVLLPDLMADNIYRSVQAGARFTSYANQSVTSTDGYALSLWQQLYSIVINANTIINKYPAVPVKSSDSLEFRQLIGEAYAARALAYFDLTRFFAYSYTKMTDSTNFAVPIVLGSYPNDLSEVEYPARSSTADCYAQIFRDKDSALQYLNPNGNVLIKGAVDPSLFRIRLNYFSVNALAARAYLYKGDYANAIQAASIVIASPRYSLLPASTLTSDFHSQGNSESIFEIANNAYNNQGSNSIAYIFNQNGYGEMLAPDTMYNIYDTVDARRGFITPGRRNSFGGEDSTYIINKYSNITNYQENIKIFRLAEMYLIRSEALALSSGVQSAIPDLITITSARKEILKADTSSKATLVTFMPTILLENRKEFAFEGHRIFDLTRIHDQTSTRLTTTYAYYHYRYQTLTKGQIPRSGAMISTLKKYALLPIPNTDRKNNIALTQNLGY
ncbi:RagB/SusD family nutrient uptake outer membrane protein [Parasediminibacterium sp. JCM 36343]|uniref:RagB/SusD family nutrient uptake outer membrane protein n=1 Tax=Parasediminibacterium sp. JCM 36343 TaxID=3374279 RepID=UPI003978FD5B